MVTCRNCGREYDPTRFEFGRTLWCACGRRVGIEPADRGLAPAEAGRFVADAMLGGLARWLRLLGFDCTHDAAIQDSQLVRQGVLEQRFILTRDRRLPEEWWVPGIYVVHEVEVRCQLAEVLRHFELSASIELFSRCSDCNQRLEPATGSELAARVPPRILRTHDAFWQCQACGRAYWEGSHTTHMRHFVDALVATIERGSAIE